MWSGVECAIVEVLHVELSFVMLCVQVATVMARRRIINDDDSSAERVVLQPRSAVADAEPVVAVAEPVVHVLSDDEEEDHMVFTSQRVSNAAPLTNTGTPRTLPQRTQSDNSMPRRSQRRVRRHVDDGGDPDHNVDDNNVLDSGSAGNGVACYTALNVVIIIFLQAREPVAAEARHLLHVLNAIANHDLMMMRPTKTMTSLMMVQWTSPILMQQTW